MIVSGLGRGLKRFWKDDRGIGTLEMILIIVVILVIAYFFKDQLFQLVQRLFANVNQRTNEFIKD
ncbi:MULTISPECIES: Flp1 family type IVb pilin [Paenibacillus]|uniref:Putative Flagellin Flp1-like domain-containing protein n=1 Tax=Paenibacillus campinasensis TaxID=66347 RepID=A0A268EWU9_9BACL|nr:MULTISPECIES: Flp1 family type IVb pilin [Paenibacillus]MUG68322.1 hypothetical protein [Paenibacillus campinasensis]PAD77600.1 hypothetical protein CHH67_09035 [Paenibacillus campinasensis]PAK49741.1 hypothetical protein CHH75_19360 [Paenibacillus sp. 7541]